MATATAAAVAAIPLSTVHTVQWIRKYIVREVKWSCDDGGAIF